MSNQSGMKGGASGMEQAKVPVQVLEELRQQNIMLQSTMDKIRDLLTKYPEAWFLWYNGDKGGVTYDGTAKWANEYDHS